MPDAVLAAAFVVPLSLGLPFAFSTSRAPWHLREPLRFCKRAADGSQVALLKGHVWGSCQRTVAATSLERRLGLRSFLFGRARITGKVFIVGCM